VAMSNRQVICVQVEQHRC